jgi:hypothetical protein
MEKRWRERYKCTVTEGSMPLRKMLFNIQNIGNTFIIWATSSVLNFFVGYNYRTKQIMKLICRCFDSKSY